MPEQREKLDGLYECILWHVVQPLVRLSGGIPISLSARRLVSGISFPDR